MANDRLLKALLRLEFDKSSLSGLQQGFANVIRSLRDTEEAANRLGDAIQQVNEYGAMLGEMGAQMLQPFREAADVYVQGVGQTEAASIRWLRSTEQLHQAQIQLGRASVQALQPMQDQLVRLSQAATSFVTQHPEILQFVMQAGGVMLAAGTALTVSTQIAQTIGQAASMINKLRGLQGMGGQVLGAAGVLGVGLPLAVPGGMALGKALAPNNAAIQQQTGMDVLKTVLQIFAMTILDTSRRINEFANAIIDVIGTMLNFGDSIQVTLGLLSQAEADQRRAQREQTQVQIGPSLKDLADLMQGNIARLTGAAGAGPGALGPAAGITDQMLLDYERYLRDAEQQEKDFRYQQETQQADHDRQVLIAQQNNDRQMLQQLEDFNTERANAEREFQLQLSDLARDHDIETQRAVDEFQRDQGLNADNFNREELRRIKDFNYERQRAEQDHRRAIMDAAARLDALAVIQEQRQFVLDQQRSKQDFDKETRLNQENFARERKLAEDNFSRQQKLNDENYTRQRADMIRNFNLQDSLAREQFDRMQTRQRQEFAIQQQQSEAEFQYQLQQQKRQHDREVQQRDASYRFQLQQQLRYLTADENAMQGHYDNLRNMLQNFINGTNVAPKTSGGGPQPTSGPNVPKQTSGGGGGGKAPPTPMQAGGYSGGGPAVLHRGEFVLNPSTTAALERRMGGTLTQGRILGMGGISASISNVFNDVGQHSVEALEGMVSRATRSALTSILREYVGSTG